MAKKQISFAVTDDEHRHIKALAAKQRRGIKQLFLDMLDRLYPGWNKADSTKEDDPKN